MDRSHIVEVPSWFLTVRYVQIGLAALTLLLEAIGLGLLTLYGSPGYGVFTCIATIIICGYYVISSTSKPDLYNYIAIIVLEVFMEIWWLSAFSLTAWVASLLGIYDEAGLYEYGRWHGAYICFALAAVTSAAEWVLVTATLITFVMNVARHNKKSSHVPVHYATPAKMENGMVPPQGQVPVYVQNGQYVAA